MKERKNTAGSVGKTWKKLGEGENMVKIYMKKLIKNPNMSSHTCLRSVLCDMNRGKEILETHF